MPGPCGGAIYRHIYLCQGSPRPHQVRDLLGGLIAIIYYSKISKVRREPRTNFQESSPPGVTQDALNSPATICDNCDSTCEMLPAREAQERPCAPGFLLGAGHTGSLCLAQTKLPDSQREKGLIRRNQRSEFMQTA